MMYECCGNAQDMSWKDFDWIKLVKVGLLENFHHGRNFGNEVRHEQVIETMFWLLYCVVPME